MVRHQKRHNVWPQVKLMATQEGAISHGDQKVISTDFSTPHLSLNQAEVGCCDLYFVFIVCVKLTSRENDSTTSDLESWFSFSSPMSIIEVLWLRFSFCSLNSEPPLDTGMLSKFAIRRLTDDFSSSMYMFSISLDTNFGNLRSLDLETKTTEWIAVTISNHLSHGDSPPGASAEKFVSRELPQTRWQITAFPCVMKKHYCLLPIELLLGPYPTSLFLACTCISFIFSICKWPSSYICIHN